FNEVTVITHGFEAATDVTLDQQFGFGQLFANDLPFTYIPKQFVQMGEDISRAGGGGVVLEYDKANGEFVSEDDLKSHPNGPWCTIQEPVIRGKPLVLVMDWFKESDISDSGFAEAAADAFLAALVNLNNELGGDVFRSPMHFIAHSRGASVNDELVQRLG